MDHEASQAFLKTAQGVIQKVARSETLPVSAAMIAAARFLRLLEGDEIVLREELDEAVFNDSVMFGRWGGRSLISRALDSDEFDAGEKAVLASMSRDRLGCFVCALTPEIPIIKGNGIDDGSEIRIYDFGLFGSLVAGQALFARFIPFQEGTFSTTGFAFAFNLPAAEIRRRIAAIAASDGFEPAAENLVPLFLALHREAGLRVVPT